MATPLFSIGGLASGLDTQSIVSQLLQLERQPIVRFQQRQAELRKVDDAWGQVTTKLSGLRAALDKLKTPEALNPTTVTSSHPDAVAVTRTGAAAPGTLSFTVTRLATRHQITAGGSFASATATVGEGTFTLVRPGGEAVLELTVAAGTTLEQVAAQVNEAGAGVSARAVKVAEGDVRLVLSASGSGAAQRFQVGTAPAALQGTTVLTEGVDAALQLGSLELTRPSNVIDDLVDGARVELRATTTAAVTVTTARDAAAGAAAAKGVVDAVNATLSTLKTLTAYDPATKRSGALQGDDTARRLANDLRRAVMGAPGISLDRYGAVTFTQSAFTDALAADPDALVAAFVRTGSSADPRVRYVASTERTAAGAHTLEVTRAAQVASVTGAAYSPPVGSPKTFTVTSGGTTVNVSVDADASLAVAVGQINEALRLAGVTTLSAGEDAGALLLREDRYGAAGTFTVTGSGDWGLDGTAEGVDIAGTIDGVAATGSGARLTGTSGPGSGLVVEVTAGDVSALGVVTVTGGLAGALGAVLTWAEGDRTSADASEALGAVGRARRTLSDGIRRFDRQISDFETRLAGREQTLRQKFSALETAMARLSGQSAWLAGQLGAQQR